MIWINLLMYYLLNKLISPYAVCPVDHRINPAGGNIARVASLKTPPESMRAFRICWGLGQQSPPTRVEREFHQLNCKKKTLPISCLSFLPSGWKGISRVLLNTVVSSVYLSWIRAAFDVPAQGEVVFQQLANHWKHSMSMSYFRSLYFENIHILVI